jgi:hypothetical protein
MRFVLYFCWLLALPLCAQAPLSPAADSPFWPGINYDAKIPTLRQTIGFHFGDRLANHQQVESFLDALSKAAPNQMKLGSYGKSWEGRSLVYAVIGSEANLRRLDAIKADLQATRSKANGRAPNVPVLVCLSYGVHGNELSPTDAALLTAYHLIAGRNDPEVKKILEKVLILLIPSQNPDGRQRFIQHFEQNEGLQIDGSRSSVEHSEPWPGGRLNHYLFDMNRDWLAMTQPEIRGEAKFLLEWLPQVFVDFHEMGGDSSYFFSPDPEPRNPHLTAAQHEALEWFGRGNGQRFDQMGIPYFTRDVFDAFYPGYGASWPSYFGAIAMTYEQASTRGLVWNRADGTQLTYRDAVRNHFVASIATLETAAAKRESLLQQFANYQKSAVEEGRSEEIKAYLLRSDGNAEAAKKLVRILQGQGVQIAKTMTATAEHPANSFLIVLAQPAKRLIRTLLDQDVKMPPDFVVEQERLRAKKLPDEIYDITAWSLPLLFGVESFGLTQIPAHASWRDDETRIAQIENSENGQPVAYLVPWNSNAAGRVLTAALRAGLTVRASERAFKQNGNEYPRGSLIFLVKENPSDLRDKMQTMAKEYQATIRATPTSWMDRGVNFGSRYVRLVPKVKIALAWDTPVSTRSAGAARFVLERQYGYPATIIRTSDLGRADLSEFQVLILPEGSASAYGGELGSRGIQNIKDWVTKGGALVALGSATEFLADVKVGLLSTTLEFAARPEKAEEKKIDDGKTAGVLISNEEEYKKQLLPTKAQLDSAAGAIVRANPDPDHWVTAGYSKPVHVLAQGRTTFSPLRLDKGVNAFTFAATDQLVASGYLWEENKRQLAWKPFVMVESLGKGNVIAFTADPNFRAYMDGLNLLFLNAVFGGARQSDR